MTGSPAPLRVVFMGTPDFAVPALQATARAGMDICCVYTQPPRPAGRGYALRPGPVHMLAESLRLPVRYPVKLTRREADDFAALRADVALVAAYGLLLPQSFLDAPRLGCVNLHASLLPRWRGADPIRRAVLAGDRQSGVTCMQMTRGLDSGPILRSVALEIAPRMTGGELHDALAALAGRMAPETLTALAAGRLTARPQPETGVSYAGKISRADARLDWSRDAAALERQIRAFAPQPGAWCLDENGAPLKILAAEVAPAPFDDAPPGAVLDETPLLRCGDGALRLLRLQRQGGKPLAAAEFQRGRGLPVGARCS